MKSPREKLYLRKGFTRLQIDVTNKCFNECIYCTRYIRHLRKDLKWEMDLGTLCKILETCTGFPSTAKIGIIGGEPQMHSEFKDLCRVVRNYLPPGKVALFTSIDPDKSKYKEDIKKTFSYVPMNLHTQEQRLTCEHHPFTLAVQDMVEDGKLQEELIDGCWVGDYWCFSASPMGIYHCEVAFGIAMLMGDKTGWPIEPRWWDRDTMDNQRHLCYWCGGCIPMQKQLLCNIVQKVSPSFLRLLKKYDLPTGYYDVVEKPFTPAYMAHWAKTWRPSQYRAEADAEAEATGAFLGNRVDWSRWGVPDYDGPKGVLDYKGKWGA